ncbi:MAG: YfhO family protein [Pyrinomonadaceae bacterium]
MPEANAHAHSGNSEHSTTVKRALLHGLLVIFFYSLLFIVYFAPVLFSADLLAPGDGILYFLPNFYAKRALWDASLWGGFPAVGDSQLMMWYPPAPLFSLLKSWNAFLLSAYVLAASFTYAYVFALTRSRFAAMVGGIVYGMSGFFIAHLGHASLIHAAAWLPLFLLSLEQLARGRERRGEFSSFWYAVGALSVACGALAGHPQIFVYMLSLGGAYALVRGWQTTKRWLYYFLCAALVLTGTGLAAMQLVPTAELAPLSLRAALGFAEFTSYALPPQQTPMLLFPYLFGGSPGTPLYDLPYFGAWGSEAGGWGAGELSGYVGLLPLMLASIGFCATGRRALAWFWFAACVVAFLLVLGDATPLAQVSYRLPVINKFRVPARHFMELSLGVSVLAGFGVKAVLDQTATKRLLNWTLLVAICSVLACLLAVLALSEQLNALAALTLKRPLSFLPWANPATGIPLLVLCAACAALIYWHRRPLSAARRALLLCVLALDLASFTWFYEWHYGAPYKVFQAPPAAATPLRDALDATHQRLLPVRGGTGRVSEIPPNLSKLWRFTSASGYGPFILTRLSRLLTMPPHGSVDDASWRDPANQSIDLMAVRYLFVPSAGVEPPATSDERGYKWTLNEFNALIGSGCGVPNPDSFTVDLPAPARANFIALDTALACSAAVADGAEVARVVVTDTNGRTYAQPLRAGSDTSEWAYDCADVRPTMRQSRAPIFRSYPVARGDVRCAGHDYVARLPLPASVRVKRVEIQWVGEAGTLSLKKISLLDESDSSSSSSVPIVPLAGSLADATRWRHMTDIDASNSGYGAIKSEDAGAARVYENLRARPRAWLVGKVLTVGEEEALNAIRSSRLADGSAFDPAQVALVEEPLEFTAEQLNAGAAARIKYLSDERMEVETTSNAPAFLVTSDVFYPGWRATVDGTPAPLFQTNYAFRGVAVPAGTHTVRFEFKPRSFYKGALLSAASLLLLGACVFWLRRKERQGN